MTVGDFRDCHLARAFQQATVIDRRYIGGDGFAISTMRRGIDLAAERPVLRLLA